MRVANCPSQAELFRAFLESAEPSLLHHIEGCEACSTEWRALGELRALGKQLPSHVPDAAELESQKAQLLAKLESPPSSKIKMVPLRYLAVSAALGAAACLVLLFRLWGTDRHAPSETGAFRATVVTQGGNVHFVHERVHGDEWVRLSSGKLLIEVAPLQKGERFRVIAPDGEVEVRGTAFETEVVEDHLVSVRVLHGRVEVRPPSKRTLILGPGERWQARLPATATAPLSVPSPVPSVAPPVLPAPPSALPSSPSLASAVSSPAAVPAESEHKPSHAVAGNVAVHRSVSASPSGLSKPETEKAAPVPATTSKPVMEPAERASEHPVERPAVVRAAPASAAERAFDEGWSALRKNDFAGAADAFSRAEQTQTGEALVEDARFWRAVALGRAGQVQAEAAAFQRFLSLHGSSPRAGEASAILGWLLLKQGQTDEAAKRFADASRDPREEVRQSARAGLAAIERTKKTAP